MLRVYYAHPMSWYNTSAEQLDMAVLEAEIASRAGAENGYVINPNTPVFKEKVEQAIDRDYPVMQVFADAIRNEADVVAFRPFRDGKLGTGVAREVLEARAWGKQVWGLYGTKDKAYVDRQPFSPSQFDMSTVGFPDILSVRETKDRISKGVM